MLELILFFLFFYLLGALYVAVVGECALCFGLREVDQIFLIISTNRIPIEEFEVTSENLISIFLVHLHLPAYQPD